MGAPLLAVAKSIYYFEDSAFIQSISISRLGTPPWSQEATKKAAHSESSSSSSFIHGYKRQELSKKSKYFHQCNIRKKNKTYQCRLCTDRFSIDNTNMLLTKKRELNYSLL